MIFLAPAPARVYPAEGLSQKCGMHGFHRLLAFGQVDHDGDFDLAGGNHADVDAFAGEGLEHFAGHPGVAFHAYADDGELANLFVGDHFAVTRVGPDALDDFAGFEQFGLIHGERDVGGGRAGAVADILHDHIDVDRGVAERLENLGGNSRFVGHGHEGDLGLVLVERDAADDDVLHVLRFFFHDGSWVVVETGADFEDDAEFFGELDRAALHHLRAEAGQLKHFVVGNLAELARAGHDARVGGIDAIDVGVNLAKIGLECRRQRDRGQVGAAASEGRDLAFGRLALKAGDDDNVSVIEQRVDLFGSDILDFRLRMNAVGQYARLRAGQGNGFDVQRVERHRRQRDGGLLAGGQQHVQLAFAGERHDFLGELDQVVGHTAHGGDDDDDLVALGAVFGDAAGDVLDARRIAHRSADVLLNNEGHGSQQPEFARRAACISQRLPTSAQRAHKIWMPAWLECLVKIACPATKCSGLWP